MPADIEAALLAGEEPWDGIDAVFISHHHGDHFDPGMILKLLRAHPAIELFGPEQAAAAIRKLVTDPDDSLLQRIHGLSLENGMSAADITFGPLLVEAIRIRHMMLPLRLIVPVGRFLRLFPLVKVFSVAELKASLEVAGFEIDYEWQPKKSAALFMVCRKD